MLRDWPFDDHAAKELMPLSRLYEIDSKWILEIDLPMVNKEGITVNLTSSHIVITAKLEKTYCVSRLSGMREYNYFKKVSPLPPDMDQEKISAKFSNGILTISMPKVLSGKEIRVD